MVQTTATTTYYILEEDKALARERIAELEAEIQALGPAFHEALNQTSETWHDNAPFDALREKQAVLAAELQSLREVISKAAPAPPAVEPHKVTVGSHVKLQQEHDKSPRHYFLAGHWTYRLGQLIDNAMIISCSSPLGQALLGKRIGEMITLPNKQQLTLVELH